jgi:D-alanine-D-alanine ligase
MGNSFGYASIKDDSKILEEANRVLKKGGIIILDTPDGAHVRDNFEKRSWEWMDENTFVCREREIDADKTRLAMREMICDTRKGVLRDQFYEEYLYSYPQVQHALKEAGLTAENNTSHCTGQLSLRNQDLGMMNARMIIKARKVMNTMTEVVNDIARSH